MEYKVAQYSYYALLFMGTLHHALAGISAAAGVAAREEALCFLL